MGRWNEQPRPVGDSRGPAGPHRCTACNFPAALLKGPRGLHVAEALGSAVGDRDIVVHGSAQPRSRERAAEGRPPLASGWETGRASGPGMGKRATHRTAPLPVTSASP